MLLGLFLSLVPTIFQLDDKPRPNQVTGLAAYLWPLCFMVGFAPAAIMNVLEEKRERHQHPYSFQKSSFIASFLVLASADLQEEERDRLQRGLRYDNLELGGAKERPINIIFFLFWLVRLLLLDRPLCCRV